MKTIIKNGTIVNADNEQIADILIENDKISKIGDCSNIEVDKTIDASGKFVIPGGIDPHVHMHLPTPAGYSSDDFESGSKAALFGGTTTIIDFVTPEKGQSLVEAYKLRVSEAQNAHINVKFHVSPIEWLENTAAEMEELVIKYGVTSFKIYLAYKGAVGLNDDVIIKVLETAKKLGVLVTAHCENDEIINILRKKFISEGKTSPKYHALSRPAEAEVDAIRRLILFARYIETPVYIVHVSTKNGVEMIKKAQSKGLPVYAETCPHYLLLEESVYEGDFEKTGKYVLSPPLRLKKDNEALWNAISDGTVQTVGTDHCPFNLKGQKDKGINDFTKIPNGAGGIEHRMELLYTYGVEKGLISMQKIVEITSSNAAGIFRLNNKGAIKEGFDADIVIWNPQSSKTISLDNQHQNCDSNIYEGFKTKGKAETVILNGEIIIDS
ncbi:MAG: dihydropyrimidinase [Bacteroidales bacterium]|nr:dihydropyrimidinase [Bacteroidales bacterium]